MNVPWYGELPKQWESKRVAAILVNRKEKNNPIKTDFILSLSAKNGVTPYAERADKGGNKPKEDLSNYAIACKGDLLVNCMNVLSGASGVTKWDGAISPVYYALYPRDNNVNIWYYNYIFRLVTFYKSLIGLGKGILFRETEGGALNTIRLRISMTNLNNEFLPLPPRDEQDQIVRYLDWKVSQINRIINAKRKQIGLLGELKRAVVSEAVTRSGEGWETRFLSQVCSEQNIKNTGNVENNILSLSYGSIIRKKNMNSALIPTDFATWQIVDDGNIILRLTDLQNDQRSLRTGLVRERGIVTSAYTCLKAWDNPAYLQLVLHAYDVRKYFYGLGGGVRQSIGYKDIRYMEIPYPTRDKQDKIADFLDQQCANIDNITDKLTDEITLFTEYRTRLISDVVTGKLDVRDVIVPVFETINDAFKTDEEVAVE